MREKEQIVALSCLCEMQGDTCHVGLWPSDGEKRRPKRRSGGGKLSVGGTLEHIRADPVSIRWTSEPKQPVRVTPPGVQRAIDSHRPVRCLFWVEGWWCVVRRLKGLSRLLGFLRCCAITAPGER